jgi:glycyl-tRNA synthetase beta chain
VTDFLLELRSEEIPARMQAGARAELEKLFRQELIRRAFEVPKDGLTVWSTPRRLTLIARGLPDQTDSATVEVKGPKADAPAQALEGFLRKHNTTRDQLTERNGILFLDKVEPGLAMTEVLAEAIPAIVRGFSWPKSMRWGKESASSESLRWVRPLSGIVAIFGEELVPCEIGGIASGFATRGHRFHCPGEITIGSAADYAEKLRACHVIVDHEERQAITRDGAAKAAADAGLTLVDDEGLVIENAGLTEWPVPLLGRFDEAFLEVPPEVIQLTARVNQKYFVCQSSNGKLANGFVCTANIDAVDGGAEIVAGNRKVLAARLSDARFFWEQDQKKTLAQHAEKLANITFHEKLGTVADKVERVAKLAEWLASEGIVPNCDPVLARQAAELAKADLVTEMVGEFPELQGLMGGYYARAEGLPDAVADAIRDHYKPVGQGDDVPTAPVTVAVALADKLDTLFGFFREDMFPTGSKDPFALRRAGISSLRLMLQNGLKLSTDAAATQWLGQSDPSAALSEKQIADRKILTSIPDFLTERLAVQLREAGVSAGVVQASREWNSRDDTRLDRTEARARDLQAFLATEDGTNLLAGYKRAANILKQAGDVSGTATATPPTDADAALLAALDVAEPAASAAVAEERFTDAMAALASLRAPIDAFFDGVMVNDPDEAVRAYRLGLLSRFTGAVHGVADFSKIEG